MLSANDEPVTEAQCEVRLPDEWDDFFSYHGPVQTTPFDQRRHPRFYLRTTGVLTVRATLAARQPVYQGGRAYVKDVSRSGIAAVYGEQLFPREQVSIALDSGREFQVRITRCRRVMEDCYEVSGEFMEAE